MYEPAPLSSEQLAEFDVNGALLLKGLLDPAMCADMRGQYWRLLEAERPGTQHGDPTTWPTQRGRLPNVTSLEPSIGTLPQVRAVVEQLARVGGWTVGGGDMALKPIFPSCAPEDWEGPPHLGGHVDGYGGVWVGSGLRLGMTAYIDDVDAHSGCFTYWPTGHTAVARYFAEHPETIDGSFQRLDSVGDGCESVARLPNNPLILVLANDGRCVS